jgi:hypothetical protein
MRNEKRICFKQSTTDFPLSVSLNSKIPEWGLNRWKTNKGLRFIPPDDEGFTLRGDKQRLVYKGRRRSHRFTILGDMAFEYDCILEREPESNVISLHMEGAENFDFFRQPNYVEEPFLKGSYAVYKKETLVGEGTGKLCHIHRPEVIDAMGRRCWGELSVVGNELHITIPEQWLGEAKYPVIVDPTLGTTTVGSQYLIEYDPPDDPWTQLMFEGSIPVNRFLVSDPINGSCTAYLYTNDSFFTGEEYGQPVLYSDNSNKPQTRKSMNEGLADFHIYRGLPAGWRNANFSSNGTIASGSYIWFGVFVDFYWEPRFDYGSKCFVDDWYNVSNTIPNTYPIYNANWYENYRLSMYFTYTGAAQNYQRTLTQGVSLTDNRILTGSYKRTATQTVQADATPTKHLTIFKSIQDTLSIFSLATKMLTLFARIQDTLGSLDLAARMISVLSSIKDSVNSLQLSRSSFLIFRNIHEGLNTTDTMYHLRNIIRGLADNVGIDSEGKTGFLHFRTISETAQAITSVFRGMVYFARIVTGVFIRDYLLSRFLKSKAELSIKSCVCRGIVLESRIQG